MNPLIAKTGIVGGAAGILASVGLFFGFYTDPTNVLHVYDGIKYHSDPGGVFEKTGALVVAIVGSIVLTVLSAYLHPSPAQPEKV